MDGKISYLISDSDYITLVSLARLGANQVEKEFGRKAHTEIDVINQTIGFVKAK